MNHKEMNAQIIKIVFVNKNKDFVNKAFQITLPL